MERVKEKHLTGSGIQVFYTSWEEEGVFFFICTDPAFPIKLGNESYPIVLMFYCLNDNLFRP